VAKGQSNSYSSNIVGYATVSIEPGYNLLANPFNAGVTNGADEIMPILDGEIILTWNGRGFFNYAGYDSGFGGWVAADGTTRTVPPSLPPGVGFFLHNPLPVATNFVFIGQVTPGPSSTNHYVFRSGFSLWGSPLPANVTKITNAPVNLPVIDGMLILQWNGSNYIQTGFDSGFGGWVGADGQTPSVAPSYRIGEGFFWFNPIPDGSWDQGLP